MIRKRDHGGSMYELSNASLRQLLTAANYRGLKGVARALRSEQVRRSSLGPTPLPDHYIMRDNSGAVVYSCDLGAARRRHAQMHHRR